MRRLPRTLAIGLMVPTLVVAMLIGAPARSAVAEAAVVAPEAPISAALPVVESASLSSGNEQTVLPQPAARVADIPMSFMWQSWNNCGPASVSMLLSTYGVNVSQETLRLALRGTNIARGMGPQGVDPWVSTQLGMRAFNRDNGSLPLLKTLITNGFAPMVTQWLDDYSRISHWRAVRGYSEDAGVFYVSDPMRGAAVPLTFEWFENNWRPFQFRYLLLYRPSDEPLLKSILGADWLDTPSRLDYLKRSKAEALQLGSSDSWLSYGEAAYQAGRPEESAVAFEKGMSLGSTTGVFNVRSSYPAVLKLLGRDKDSEAATTRFLAAGTNGVTNRGPDESEVRLMRSVGGFPEIVFRIGEQLPLPARIAADPVFAR